MKVSPNIARLLGGLSLVAVAACTSATATNEAQTTSTPTPTQVAVTASPEPTPTPTPTPTPRPPGKFVATGSMKTARSGHTATLLEDGRVLIAGGWNSGWGWAQNDPLSSAEIYDPRTGKFTSTGSMRTARTDHTATRLADGRVLIAGGSTVGDDAVFYTSAETYDPKTGKFSRTGSMAAPRSGHASILLGDGRVFVVGGGMGGPLAEIYDPSSGKFQAAGFEVDQWIRGAAWLSDERVLILGESLAWVYDAGTDSFAPTGSSSVPASALLVPLADGRVFVGDRPVPFMYDPTSGAFTPTGAPTSQGRLEAVALLGDGAVLIIAADGSAEIFDPTTGQFSRTGSLSSLVLDPSVTALLDGRALVAGGQDDDFSNKAQLYVP